MKKTDFFQETLLLSGQFCARFWTSVRFLGIALLLGVPTHVSAQYFMSGGVGYHILSEEDHTVEVSGKENCTPYSGKITIPATVTNNDITYDVVALGEQAFAYANLTGVSIPSSVTQIKRGCFLSSNGPSIISVPASVTVIEPLAFAASGLNTLDIDPDNPNYMTMDKLLYTKDTTTLVECLLSQSGTVVLPQSTRHLGRTSFAYCQNITGVTLPEGLQSIGYWAFVANQNLNNIVIPSTVTHIAAGPFVNCPSLNNLTIAEGNTHYYMDGMMIYSAAGDSLVSCHKSEDSVFLSSTLRYVNGFGGNSDIKYVNVPNEVTAIGSEAFNGSSLVSIDLPSHLDIIDEWTFNECHSLTHVGMPTTLDSMGEGCFYYCDHLTSIKIPDGLRVIPEGCFFMCNALKNITWGNAVEVIDTCALGDCVFTKLTLPPTLRSVRYTAFIANFKKKLKRVTFSAPVDTIEAGAFYGHPLKMLRLRNTQPPVTTDEGCLFGINLDSLIVPCGYKDAYLADSYWGQFAAKLVEDCDLGVEEVAEARIEVYPNPTTGVVQIQGLVEEAVEVELFDLSGHPVATYHTATFDISHLAQGVYLVLVKSPGSERARLQKLIKR